MPAMAPERRARNGTVSVAVTHHLHKQTHLDAELWKEQRTPASDEGLLDYCRQLVQKKVLSEKKDVTKVSNNQ